MLFLTTSKRYYVVCSQATFMNGGVFLLFLCIYVNQTYKSQFGSTILLNFDHGSEVRKAYQH